MRELVLLWGPLPQILEDPVMLSGHSKATSSKVKSPAAPTLRNAHNEALRRRGWGVRVALLLQEFRQVRLLGYHRVLRFDPFRRASFHRRSRRRRGGGEDPVGCEAAQRVRGLREDRC